MEDEPEIYESDNESETESIDSLQDKILLTKKKDKKIVKEDEDEEENEDEYDEDEEDEEEEDEDVLEETF